MVHANKTPEQIARDIIDKMLKDAEWVVQSKHEIDFSAGKGIAVREYQTNVGFADYVLFVDKKPVGIIEAKPEKEGYRLSVVEEQSTNYANSTLKYLKNDPLPFVYESTGVITRFTDYRDPKPRGRGVFGFHKPETLAEWLKKGVSLASKLQDLPSLEETGLRNAQIIAISNLEKSFKNNRPRALIQMATGAGKTFAAATFIYRLLKFADAKRILFLVDTKNLGEQAEQEFMNFQPTDDNRKFIELYNVQRLNSNYIASDSHVCISTIQRLYSILRGEELDQNEELENPNENTWLKDQKEKKRPATIEYSSKVPIEQFDFIVIDECHRSIYNIWKQVFDYFDAFLVGLTATPDNRTFGFFKENVVSEYSYETSVADGVNVPYDVYTIETDISKNGNVVRAGWYVDRRDKKTRKARWQQEEEDTHYTGNDLDKSVVNPSQIRHIIREYRDALKRDIFPDRIDHKGEYEVPKTLVFAKTDSHAGDIVNIIREEFDEGNDFCKKVTYKSEDDPKSVLNRFRNSYYPRIAVTVDMISTGTDVKPLEVLLFMRDVKSSNYFEQMKGRGTRTINTDVYQLVTRTATHKTHFVIVDAVGVTQSEKLQTTSRSLERKPTIPLKDLLGAITMGVEEEDLFLSLANRMIRIEKQISGKEKEKLLEYSKNKSLRQITRELLAAYDPDAIEEHAEIKIGDKPIDRQEYEKVIKESHQKLISQAASTFNGPLNQFIDNIRRVNEQIIDHVNIDTVIKSEWDTSLQNRAREIIGDFSEYLEAHKDGIEALRIYYDQPYNRRNITFKMIREVMERLKTERPQLAPPYVWGAYSAIGKVKSKHPTDELTILLSLIRHVCGIDQELKSYEKTIDENFKAWIFRQNAGQHSRFSSEQMDWLRMIKDHVASSYHIEIDDLDFTPFDAYGGRGKMFQLFGNDMNSIVNELNEALSA